MAVFKRIHQRSEHDWGHCTQQQASGGGHDGFYRFRESALHCRIRGGDGRIYQRGGSTTYIVIEQNDCFYEMLRKQFQGMPGVVLIHGDAGNVCSFLREQGFKHADYIISGLPFTSLPRQVSHRILSQTQEAIGAKGVFTTFQYTLLRKAFLENYFHIRRIVRVWQNLPPAYVLHMK